MKGSFTVNECHHGNNHWRIEGKINGKRIRAFYRTKEAADMAARLRNHELLQNGHRLADIPNHLRAEALRCTERLVPVGATLTQAVDYYLAHHDTRSNSLTVTEACEQFIADYARRAQADEVGHRHHKNLVGTLRKFNEAFSSELICDISSNQIDIWLNSLPLASESKNHHRSGVRRLFEVAKKRGWTKQNPVAEVDKISDRKTRTKLPGILSIHDAARLLEAANPDILPVIALGLFAGLRPAEIHKLRWQDIYWVDRQIDVSAKISKTASRRFVQMSNNLLEWLAPYRNATGPIFNGSEFTMIRAVTGTARLIGIAKWPQNALRHSFGSYHLAAHQNAAQTALQMGHATTETTFAHYNNRRTEDEGRIYFQISPGAKNVIAIATVATA